MQAAKNQKSCMAYFEAKDDVIIGPPLMIPCLLVYCDVCQKASHSKLCGCGVVYCWDENSISNKNDNI